MPALREIQTAFSAAILTGEPGVLPIHVAPIPLGAERRIQIYRNHFTISLIECLTATFPVLKSLVGEIFFDQCARSFATNHPPSSPVLFEYGETFPAFVADATRSRDFAYLTDVGAFEWAINHAYHADDAEPLDSQTFLGVPEETRGDLMLHLHPSLRLVVSYYPILEIWRANQSCGDATRTIDVSSGDARLLVWRNGIDVAWRQLDAPEATFYAALMNGSTLTNACDMALAVDTTFEPTASLTNLIGNKLITDFSIATQPTER